MHHVATCQHQGMEWQGEQHAPCRCAHDCEGLATCEANACLQYTSYVTDVLPAIRWQRSKIIRPCHMCYDLEQLMVLGRW